MTVIQGLQSAADKMRTPSNAKYDRVEISKVFGIRYQHVRNVLVRSGIGGGLRREVEVGREAVTVDATPPAREDTPWEASRKYVR